LSGAHVLILTGQTDYSDAVMARIATYVAAGGGLVFAQTSWAASDAAFADSVAMLNRFGLVPNKTYSRTDAWTVGSSVPSAFHSAHHAAEALVADKEGTRILSTQDRNFAADAIYQVVETRNDIGPLRTKLELLSQPSHYGLITPLPTAPIRAWERRVEKMLALYQSRVFDALLPEGLFEHPGAADFPGVPDAGAPIVSRSIVVNGNTPRDFYMNHGNKPTRTETALYAPPGKVITVRIPGHLVGEGIEVLISGNGSEDQTLDVDEAHKDFEAHKRQALTFFPKLWRRVPLFSEVTRTGHVFGGLITVLVPAGKSLGNFNVTIEDAIEAPAFVLGQTTDVQWNESISKRRAPYGYIQMPKLTIYLPKWQLTAMDQPTAVAEYWQRVMDTMDHYSSYAAYRKRGEAMTTARYVRHGGAYAGYPVENGWGTARDEMLDGARFGGHWGCYHELGHGFQNNFNDAFQIPTHVEVDVNLFPAMAYTFVHDRTSWDGPTHPTYDAAFRIPDRADFLALSAEKQTWKDACSFGSVAYDFYFNLAEAFGWELYQKAFGRLMRYLQNPERATDPELFELDSSSPNFRRDRFYLLFCDAAQRNLDAYFQRYGLGVPGKGYDITLSVKEDVAEKGYATWTDNTPIDSLSTPGALSVREDLAPGTEIYQFVARDAEEPGTIWDYAIVAGNIDGAFSIDRRTGKLRAENLDAETRTSYTLTVEVKDNGVPRHALSQSFTVNVTNAAEAPQVEGKIFKAASTMSNGTSLGTVRGIIEAGRSVRSYAIVAGNTGHFSIHSTTGLLSVTNASTLPNPGVVLLTIRLEDSTGAVGFGKAAVLCNKETGLLEERWASGRMVGAPSSTALFQAFSAPSNQGAEYVRRVSGWIVPEKSGSYRFWIAADDFATLSISPDEKAVNRVPACSVDQATGAQSWNSRATQQSRLVRLKAGHPYYVEAHHREVSGADHLAVAWEGPGIARQVIPTSILIPKDATSNFPSSVLTPIEQWRINHFGALAGDLSVAGHSVDYDRDGRRNLAEYAMGTHPARPDATLPWQVKRVSGRMAISFQHNRAATEVTLTVQGSDNLTSWSNLARSVGGASFTALASGVTIDETGTGPLRTVEVRDRYNIGDPARPRRFLRLHVSVP
jgi:hypothetical protein